MEQNEKILNLEEKVAALEESLKVLVNLNLDQIQTIIFKLDKMEKNLSSLLFKQI